MGGFFVNETLAPYKIDGNIHFSVYKDHPSVNPMSEKTPLISLNLAQSQHLSLGKSITLLLAALFLATEFTTRDTVLKLDETLKMDWQISGLPEYKKVKLGVK